MLLYSITAAAVNERRSWGKRIFCPFLWSVPPMLVWALSRLFIVSLFMWRPPSIPQRRRLFNYDKCWVSRRNDRCCPAAGRELLGALVDKGLWGSERRRDDHRRSPCWMPSHGPFLWLSGVSLSRWLCGGRGRGRRGRLPRAFLRKGEGRRGTVSHFSLAHPLVFTRKNLVTLNNSGAKKIVISVRILCLWNFIIMALYVSYLIFLTF